MTGGLRTDRLPVHVLVQVEWQGGGQRGFPAYRIGLPLQKAFDGRVTGIVHGVRRAGPASGEGGDEYGQAAGEPQDGFDGTGVGDVLGRQELPRLGLREGVQRYVRDMVEVVGPAGAVQRVAPGQDDHDVLRQRPEAVAEEDIAQPGVQERSGRLVRVEEEHQQGYGVGGVAQFPHEDRGQHLDGRQDQLYVVVAAQPGAEPAAQPFGAAGHVGGVQRAGEGPDARDEAQARHACPGDDHAAG